MTTSLKRRGLAIGVAGATILAAITPSFAAPVLSGSAGVKAAVADGVVDVRWRRGGGIAAGFAAGALAGAAIGAAAAPRYYYGPGYGYGSGYPAYGAYGYEGPVTYGAPVYGSSYAYPYQTCGVDAGYGRWDYSSC
jgi:hypothetical protein